jgi:hypothetical protein
MAGVRDIGNSFPFGQSARSTHYFPSRNGTWVASERGVIEAPYISGIPPEAMFFEYNSARTNMAKSHLDIKSTGYNTRKMACAMVDLIVSYNGVVEDCGRIVMFSTPLFNPEFGAQPLDVRTLCACLHVDDDVKAHDRGDESAIAAVSDEAIRAGFVRLVMPHHTQSRISLGQSLADTFLDACTKHAPRARSKLYYTVRRIAAKRMMQPGFPAGTVAAADINQSVTQSTLDAFHSTSSDTTASHGARFVLEQKKFSYPTFDARTPHGGKDSLSKAKLSGTDVTVAVIPNDTHIDEWKARILKEVQPSTLANVVESMQLVYHSWLSEEGGFAEGAPLKLEHASDLLSVELHDAMKHARIAASLLRKHRTHGSSLFFGTTLRIATLPGIHIRDVYAIRSAVENALCPSKTKPQYALFWNHPLEDGDRAFFRVCIRMQAPKPSVRKAPVRRTAVQTSSKRPRKDDENDDNDDAETECSSESDSETTDDDDVDGAGDGVGDGVGATLPDSMPLDQDESELERDDQNDSEDESFSENESTDVSEDDEDDDGDGEAAQPVRGRGSKAAKSRVISDELNAFDALYAIVMGRPYIEPAGSTKTPMQRYIKSKSLKARANKHGFLHKVVWKGVPGVNANVRIQEPSPGAYVLVVPDCRVETLVRHATSSMLLESLESTHHGNNIIMFGIEIASRLMRKSLKHLWPNMPYFYIFLLVEHVACTGRIVSVNNHGIIQEKGPFNRLCFEKSADYLLKSNASGHDRRDELDSHVARTFFGMNVKAGTGVSDVFMHEFL